MLLGDYLDGPPLPERPVYTCPGSCGVCYPDGPPLPERPVHTCPGSCGIRYPPSSAPCLVNALAGGPWPSRDRVGRLLQCESPSRAAPVSSGGHDGRPRRAATTGSRVSWLALAGPVRC